MVIVQQGSFVDSFFIHFSSMKEQAGNLFGECVLDLTSIERQYAHFQVVGIGPFLVDLLRHKKVQKKESPGLV